jgi:hypothetical protein
MNKNDSHASEDFCMFASVRALLNQIIDYAGLFPPAKLPLAVALRVYIEAKRSSPHAWMLGRFVCPAGRLAELLTLTKVYPDASLLRITALGQQSSDATYAFAHLDWDIEGIRSFRRRGDWGDDRIIDSFELALPAGIEIASIDFEPLVGALTEVGVHGYIEMAPSANWQCDVAQLATRLNKTGIGLKIRTGGTTAQGFPSDGDVAFFIEQCRAANLPWKATAGLHHPRRHWDDALKVWHHGFLNVFAAGLLASANSLSRVDLVSILADQNGDGFVVDDSQIAWKQWSCPLSQINAMRASFATSFGSCSFDEPVADLIAMGLLSSETN